MWSLEEKELHFVDSRLTRLRFHLQKFHGSLSQLLRPLKTINIPPLDFPLGNLAIADRDLVRSKISGTVESPLNISQTVSRITE